MNEIRTSWSKKAPPFGAFDDYIIIESIGKNERILIRPEEFDFLASELLANWKLHRSKYIQLLKEWNECTGFNSLKKSHSFILDIDDTIDAIERVKGSVEIEFGKLSDKDLKLISSFFISHKKGQLKIWKD